MTTASNDDEGGRKYGAWLDEDDDPPPISTYETSTEEQVRIADLQLVDALLSQLAPPARDEQAVRIRRVMAAISTNGPSQRTKRWSVRLNSMFALAASIVLAISLFWAQFARESHANVVLQEIGRVALENVDRIYSLRRSSSTSDTHQTAEGKLYLRGRTGFVLRCGDVVLGRNGDEYWLVPQRGPVAVAENFHWMVAESEHEGGELELLQQLSVDSRRVPIMQLSAVVALMSHDYEITLRHEDRGDQSIDTIVGTLRNDTTSLPDKISLWADTASKIIHRAEFCWGPGNTLVLELAPMELMPVNWYDHKTHHDNQRDVRRVSQETW